MDENVYSLTYLKGSFRSDRCRIVGVKDWMNSLSGGFKTLSVCSFCHYARICQTDGLTEFLTSKTFYRGKMSA